MRYRTQLTTSADASIMIATTASEYAQQAKSDNTKKAYGGDLRGFAFWCQTRKVCSLPADPRIVAEYLAHLAGLGRKVSTIRRALSAISTAHRMARQRNPAHDPWVADTMTGIARVHGSRPSQKKPMTIEVLRQILTVVPDDLAGARDRAALILAFAMAARRSELVALEAADLEFVDQGLKVHIRRSKGDQEGKGTIIPVAHGTCRSTCPVRALEAWLQRSGITSGPIFPPISARGTLGKKGMTGRSFARILKSHALAAGLDPADYSGHSPRAGFITTAALKGASERQIARVSRHKSAILRDYVRTACIFEDSAASLAGL